MKILSEIAGINSLSVLGFLAVVLVPFFLFCSQKMHAPGAPENLRCEYVRNPLGLDAMQPRFSWEVQDTRRGAVQTAYRILVATRKDLLKKDQGDVWDSGKVASDQSVLVVFEGAPLESGQRYFWKVRTWDGEGKPSPFSQIAWFEMGLLKPTDWKAKWVGKAIHPQKVTPWPWKDWIWHPTQKGINRMVYFRKVFIIPKDKQISKALLRATADNAFTAFLNGKEAGKGTAWNTVYEFDVTPSVKTGENALAIEAENTRGDICGLIASLKVTFADGSFLLVNSDGSWKTSQKARTNWNGLAFNDRNWRRVKVIEPYGGKIWGKVDLKYENTTPPRSIRVRKEFQLKSAIRRARVYVTGLGSYVLYINGKRVGQDVFTPGWTDYPRRIQYQTYDVTDLLRKGENAAGAVLGNMWWSSGLGWQKKGFYSHGPLRFLMQLVVDYKDGHRDTVVTDESWKTLDSPITQNSLYNGETFDARLDQPGWDRPGFKETGWEPVILPDAGQARLVAQQGPPIRRTQEIVPVKIASPDSGVYVFDMGQNFAGRARLKVKGPAGTKVVMKFAELLKKDGTVRTDNLRSAQATDTYILRGEKSGEVWEPKFTYHGYRYVQVTGYPGVPTEEAVTGLVIHSDAPEIGSFACSNELLNRVQHNITWGLASNIMSVPTDCPQRDERLGWMGDAQIFSPTASYNRNMARFFEKWMHDISDCQDPDGAVHDVNPAIVVENPAKPAWGDAVVVIPWVVYRFYGDTRIIRENYNTMVAWLNYMEKHSKGSLYEVKGYGDWVAVEKSPTAPIGSAYFFYDAKLLSEMAKAIGKQDDSERFRQLAEKIAQAFNRKHLDPKTLEYTGATQTANLLPLAFGITPRTEAEAVVKNIVADVKKRKNHLSTGFLGTAYLLPILSDYGYAELAYQVATQTDYPSWGYMVKHGATTIWELWDSDKKGPDMNSRNHFALGSVGEWYFGYLAGIRPDPQKPGFKHLVVAPKPVGDLTWAEGRLESLYGPIHVRWEKQTGHFSLKLTIPANTAADVFVPTFGKSPVTIREGDTPLLQEGKPLTPPAGVRFVRMEKEAAVFEVGSGTYHFIEDHP
ncbi:MAG: family 78 glycoside hydrolase catalytic domain [Calditrichaeota bacterium]|nr:family 78 glycoside hydrolase catalytic domain [Calditrichota bacterium]